VWTGYATSGRAGEDKSRTRANWGAATIFPSQIWAGNLGWVVPNQPKELASFGSHMWAASIHGHIRTVSVCLCRPVGGELMVSPWLSMIDHHTIMSDAPTHFILLLEGAAPSSASKMTLSIVLWASLTRLRRYGRFSCARGNP
jgi:hypothetical protein